ncbi:MAG: dihydrodipicolinate synthase family protein, partial [Myxococcota bacterium]|nr:dihydrodipicolinate synthase family protein [Myxococcota bacterium]
FVLQGGHGVISVTSNLVPAAMVEMIHAALEGDAQKAEGLREGLTTLFDILFIESNPIPVKTAMELQGHFSAHMRLPLCEMGHTNRELLASTLRAAGLIH